MELNEEYGYFPLRISKIRYEDTYVGVTSNGAMFIGDKDDLLAAKIHETVTAVGPVILAGKVSIGKGSMIQSAAYLRNAQIRSHVRIGKSARILDSELANGCYIDDSVQIEKSYLPPSACIGQACRLDLFNPKKWLESPESGNYAKSLVIVSGGVELNGIYRFVSGCVGQGSNEVSGYSFFIAGGYLRVGCTGKSIMNWLAHPFEVVEKRYALFALANWDDLAEHYVESYQLGSSKRILFMRLSNERKAAVAKHFNTDGSLDDRLPNYKIDMSTLFEESKQ